ncbi:hypothetical protein MATL_G00127900 [Megalops atlanticus]|uniref:TNFR-Cys domain-containing protein n=1 Tax=Megalops atlanticus TaxID=7932 RepID=A0A9D3PVW3_MEGAT|nr:hypothetical protein MATL_G00127900 [Megalops atlanticus]
MWSHMKKFSQLSLFLTMQLILGVFLLCLTPSVLLSFTTSLDCNDKTKYPWPLEGSKRCCDMCKPGQRMVKRCSDSTPTECVACGKDYYSDRYDVDRECQKCRDCTMSYLVYKRNCSANHNSECACAPGGKQHLQTSSRDTKAYRNNCKRAKFDKHWAWWTKMGILVAKETAVPDQCTEEEGKMPVQEVCEKTGLQEDQYF